jgi:hypothetical protein
MVIASLILAVLSLFGVVYLYLELQKKLSNADVAPVLSQACDDLSKTYGKQYRELETEWAEMYQKFSRMLGRADKLRGLEAPPAAPEPPRSMTRSDLIRQHRRGS